MCAGCLTAIKEVFPEIPENERGEFLMGATCFPFGDAEQVHEQLVDLRSRMVTTDYRECYGIAARDLDAEMASITGSIAEGVEV